MYNMGDKSKIHDELRFPYSIYLEGDSVVYVKDEKDERTLAKHFPEFFSDE